LKVGFARKVAFEWHKYLKALLAATLTKIRPNKGIFLASLYPIMNFVWWTLVKCVENTINWNKHKNLKEKIETVL